MYPIITLADWLVLYHLLLRMTKFSYQRKFYCTLQIIKVRVCEQATICFKMMRFVKWPFLYDVIPISNFETHLNPQRAV